MSYTAGWSFIHLNHSAALCRLHHAYERDHPFYLGIDDFATIHNTIVHIIIGT